MYKKNIEFLCIYLKKDEINHRKQKQIAIVHSKKTKLIHLKPCFTFPLS